MPELDPKLQAQEPFRAVLTGHRSLGPRGFLVLMGLLSAFSFGLGLAFWRIGAWPVFAFLGLDVALVYAAFRLNYRAGRAYETVELDSDTLAVTQVDPAGAARRHEFNPYWVRVNLREWPDGRTVLELASHGRGLRFAGCLTDAERREFAEALDGALARVRRSR